MLKAHVRGGRLVLDEPTNLPDGAEVRLTPIDGDDLDDAHRAALHAELEASIAEADAGETEDLTRPAPHRPGDVLGLLGPNGAGKTTALRAVAGILQPTSGAIRIGLLADLRQQL